MASSLSIVRSAASSREQRSSIRGCSGWGCVGGLKNLTGTMADWLANAAPPQSMLVADLRAEIVARGEAPVGRKAELVAQLARLRPAPAGAQQEAGQMQQQQQQQQQQQPFGFR